MVRLDSEYNISQKRLCKMADQYLICKFLLHKLFELQILYYLHSIPQMHLCKMIDQLMAGKFLLHRQFELWML